MNSIQRSDQAGTLEQVLVQGDLSALTSAQRVEYVNRLCEHLELDPVTRPFEFIVFQGKLVCYANKGCAEQLRLKRRISVAIVGRAMEDGIYTVTARATDASGRHDEATGVLSVGNIRGDALANAMMKAETKAKRRVTLSLCGLGMMDESEIEPVHPVPVSDPPASRTAALAQKFAEPKSVVSESSKARAEAEIGNQQALEAALEAGRQNATSDDQEIDEEFFDLLARKGLTMDEIKAKASAAQKPVFDQPPHAWPDTFRAKVIERLEKKPDLEPQA